MADIFISYKREDKKRAGLIANKLQASGWSVWWDHDLLGGEDYDVIIDRELSKAKAVIVIWSALSVQSRNVKDEAKKALNHDILVPVSFDGAEPPIGFGMTHVILFENRDNISRDEYDKLFESIKNKAGAPGTVIETLPKPYLRKQGFKINRIFFAAAGFIILSLIIIRLSQYRSQGDSKPIIDTGNGTKSRRVLTAEESIATYFKERGLDSPLAGDSIIGYSVKSITNNSITLNVNYNFNTGHGNNVALGAWFWKSGDLSENNGGGYAPQILTSANGTADITITLSDLKGPYTTEKILVFLSQNRHVFTYRIFNYTHNWSP